MSRDREPELVIGVDARSIHPHYPGIGRYLFQLLGALPEALADSGGGTVRALAARDTPVDLAQLAQRGVSLTPSDLPMRSFGEQSGLRALARDWGCTLWHAPYYVTAYRPTRPLVLTLFDTIVLRDRHYLPSLRARLAVHLLTRLAIRAARRIVTLSADARDDLASRFGVDPERITVTHAGVDARFRPQSADAVAAMREALGLPARYVLYVGIDKPHKNLVRLVEAWHGLGSTGRPGGAPAETLVLAGRRDPRYPDAAVRADTLAADVRFLGPVDDEHLPALYSGATLFVLPSLIEGFGLPALEAMACGTPVACARAGSLPEVVGDAAALFDPRDTDAIATTLGRLLDDPAERRARAEQGLRRAAGFTWSRTARDTVAAYRQVAAGA